MDIQELREAREQLEVDIYRLILDFNHRTGLHVESCNIVNFKELKLQSSRTQQITARIEIELERI